MSADIDWVMVLIKTPITSYLDKYGTTTISLTNKRIRAKLFPIIFSKLTIDSFTLFNHSDYFNRGINYQFDNLTYVEKLRLIWKFRFNNELAFKELRIDPFIKKANKTLNLASVYCKSLTFDGLERCGYFLFQIFDNFLNLKKLSICRCDIPLISFNNLLSKLQRVEILSLKGINLILTEYEDPDLSKNFKFPISLKELTYLSVRLAITNCYQLIPREFIRNFKFGHPNESLEIIPQIMPNLTCFEYFDDGRGNRRMEEFKALNPNVNYVNIY